MSAPRRSREAHAERVDVTHVPAGTFDTMPTAEPSGEGRAAIWRVLARRAALDEPHTMGAAECDEPQSRHLYDHRVAPPMWTVKPVERETYTECVCEEPCRYCRCENQP